MPLTVLIALVIAFGIRLDGDVGPLTETASARIAYSVLSCLASQAILGWLFCRLVARQTRRRSNTANGWRRALLIGNRTLDLVSLGGFGLVTNLFQWPRFVNQTLGLERSILLDETLILTPFLISQIVGWICLCPIDEELHRARHGLSPYRGLGRYVLRRARQSFGLILPAALVYALMYDVIRNRWPQLVDSPYFQFLTVAALGAMMLALAPLLIRLAWSTHPLPPGPLRDRLERLAHRLHFRFTEILVWNTDRNIVNAGVTGALPWLRYVLLTDALIESLTDRQIEAVFGHEVGHVAHRHLGYFGFFCLGSLGIMALVCQGINQAVQRLAGPLASWIGSTGVIVIESLVALLFLATYFYCLFGLLSRRFERQADIYGCRAVSCDRPNCPPHLDIDGQDVAPSTGSLVPVLCPVGIQTFASALAEVAILNGLEPSARSWRHGSIVHRITFLEGLEGRPEAERRFQRRVQRLRLVLGAGLITALATALVTGALEQL